TAITERKRKLAAQDTALMDLATMAETAETEPAEETVPMAIIYFYTQMRLHLTARSRLIFPVGMQPMVVKVEMVVGAVLVPAFVQAEMVEMAEMVPQAEMAEILVILLLNAN